MFTINQISKTFGKKQAIADLSLKLEEGRIFGINMAKQGMARPDRTHTQPKNEMPPVPEIQGKAKNGKKDANPIISGTFGPDQKVFHAERPISKAYKELDNDLARDNVENDLPEADLQDL